MVMPLAIHAAFAQRRTANAEIVGSIYLAENASLDTNCRVFGIHFDLLSDKNDRSKYIVYSIELIPKRRWEKLFHFPTRSINTEKY